MKKQTNEKQSNQTHIVFLEGLKFILNTDERTAILIGCHSNLNDLQIPNSINYNAQIYFVTDISEDQFETSSSVKSIQFQPNSKILTFPNCFLAFSMIESIDIPPSIIDIKEGCFESTPKLFKFTIDPKNKYFTSYKNDFILTKSTQESDEFDVLFFARRNIERAIIPSFIKRITPFAFMNCTILDYVEIPSNSKLQIIGKYSFSYSSIQSISIPSHLIEICEGSFSDCYNFTKIEFQQNSELQKIGKKAFANTQIKSISIPSHVSEIEEYTFYYCMNLKSIDFHSNSEIRSFNERALSSSRVESISIPSSLTELKNGWCMQTQHLNRFLIDPNNKNFISYGNDFILGKSSQKSDKYDVLVFARRNIEKAIIPSFIKQIAPYAFMDCYTLTQCEISENSQLQEINEFSFHGTRIEEIYIPSCLIGLKEKWCVSIQNLTKIIVDPNNKHYSLYNNDFILGKSNQNLDVFDVLLFSRRNIEEVIIPSFIKRIGPYAFEYCNKIKYIEFQPISQLEIIDKHAFYFSSINTILIPANVTHICEGAFSSCYNLNKVEFAPKSQLLIIDNCSFAHSSVETFSIPSCLNSIGDSSFNGCRFLTNIEIPIDSKLEIIGNYAFSNSSIRSFTIPTYLKEIRKSFYSCFNLEKIIVPINSQLKKIEKESFLMTSIKSFYIPHHITNFQGSLNGCNSLQIIELSENSSLKEIDEIIQDDLGQEILLMIPVKQKK